MTIHEYEVIVREVDADYDQEAEAGYEVAVYKPGFPPHAVEFYKTEAEAQKRKRELRKSLP